MHRAPLLIALPPRAARRLRRFLTACGLLLTLSVQPAAAASQDVLTSRNDLERTGATLHERVLRPSVVNPDSFGQVFTYHLDALHGGPVGEIYAQPLYVSNLAVKDHGLVNLLLVATMRNLVFALDADGPLPGRNGILWQRELGPPPSIEKEGEVWENCTALDPCLEPIGGNIRGTAGIGSTPVIDRARGIVFVVSRVLTGQGRDVAYHLHALDLHDGHDLPGSPAVLAASHLGVRFNANDQNQRVGLAMSRGQVIVGFGAYEDLLAYRGWVFSYRYDPHAGFVQSAAITTTPDGDASPLCAQVRDTPATAGPKAVLVAAEAKLAADIVTLNLPAIPIDTSEVAAAQAAYDAVAAGLIRAAANNCAHGGIWMTGRAPAVDRAGRVLLMVGNGRNDLGAPPNRNFGNSLLALDPQTLAVLDAFTPENHVDLNAWDLDLGGSGPMIVPSSNLVIGGGKQGVMYVWPLDHLGGFAPGDSGAIQHFPVGIPHTQLDTGMDNPGGFINFTQWLNTVFSVTVHSGHIMGGPVFWPRHRAVGGSRLYNWSENAELRTYAVDESAPIPVLTEPLARSDYIQAGHPGGILSLSANGEDPTSGIVWAATYDASNTDLPGRGATGALVNVVPGTLRAYSANDLQPLWTSDQQPARDRLGKFAKFNPPTVARGRVYMATFSDAIVVYGLLHHHYARPSEIVRVLAAPLEDEEP